MRFVIRRRITPEDIQERRDAVSKAPDHNGLTGKKVMQRSLEQLEAAQWLYWNGHHWVVVKELNPDLVASASQPKYYSRLSTAKARMTVNDLQGEIVSAEKAIAEHAAPLIRTLVVRNYVLDNPKIDGYDYLAIPLSTEVIDRINQGRAYAHRVLGRMNETRGNNQAPWISRVHLFRQLSLCGIQYLSSKKMPPELQAAFNAIRDYAIFEGFEVPEDAVELTEGTTLEVHFSGDLTFVNTPGYNDFGSGDERGQLISASVWAFDPDLQAIWGNGRRYSDWSLEEEVEFFVDHLKTIFPNIPGADLDLLASTAKAIEK